MIKLKDGGYYRQKYGRIVGPMKNIYPTLHFGWSDKRCVDRYSINGTYLGDAIYTSHLNLIAPASKREIICHWWERFNLWLAG